MRARTTPDFRFTPNPTLNLTPNLPLPFWYQALLIDATFENEVQRTSCLRGRFGDLEGIFEAIKTRLQLCVKLGVLGWRTRLVLLEIRRLGDLS